MGNCLCHQVKQEDKSKNIIIESKIKANIKEDIPSQKIQDTNLKFDKNETSSAHLRLANTKSKNTPILNKLQSKHSSQILDKIWLYNSRDENYI